MEITGYSSTAIYRWCNAKKLVGFKISGKFIIPKIGLAEFLISPYSFDIGQSVVADAAGVIHGTTNIDIASTLDTMRTSMEAMGVGELLGLAIETLVISLCLKIMSILITVILYGRMIEIYCTVSIAPIPIATMSNREWGSIGTNYLKGLFALAFQGFLIMICVGIYAVLINNMIIAANIHSALFSVAAYTVILCFSLFKTGSLSKSLFNAH